MKHATPNTSLAVQGTVVEYICDEGYEPTTATVGRDDDVLMDIVCDGQHWTSLAAHCAGKGQSTLDLTTSPYSKSATMS